MILITGATGLLGSHLTYHLLKQGHSVRLLIRNEARKERLAKTLSFYSARLSDFENQIQYVEGDVTDVYSIENAITDEIDIVFHCAGLVSFSPLDKRKLLNVNQEGTENMINASLEGNVKKFIYVSSIAALGESTSQMINENNQHFEYNPASVYGNSKHYGELEVWRGVEEGLDAIIVNPTVIVGPGEWKQGSPRFFRTVWKGMPFFTTGSTGFVDVRDVCRIMADLAFSDVKNQQFILNNENLNYKQFFNMVADQLSVRRPRFEAQPWMMYAIAGIMGFFSKITRRPAQINSDTAVSAFTKTLYDNSKIEETLQTNLKGIEEAISFTANCFLQDMKKTSAE
jgi:dihydroflavonol-4-reductase